LLGRKIKVQRRGRGSPTWRAPTHKRVAPAKYPKYSKDAQLIKGKIEALLHDPGRGSPLALVKLENGEEYYTVAPEGVFVGQKIEIGPTASISVGNILPMEKVTEGTAIFNIELQAGDGGKLTRSSGSYATVVSHTPQGTLVKLPSGKSTYISGLCRATIGVVSGAGRTEKPFLKAGKRVKWMAAKGRKYPISKGIAMVAAYHPHGGGKGAMRATTVSRNAPPGQKVGLIAARQTGRKKKTRTL